MELQEGRMAGTTHRAPLILTPDEREQLETLSQSRTASKRETERAKTLLRYSGGKTIQAIHQELGLSRPTIYKCIDKALAAGVAVGLQDKFHRPKEPEITEEAKSWVVSLACTKPKDHGLAAELWTLSALAQFIHAHAEEAGFPRLSHIPRMTLWRILDAANIKSPRIRYYLKQRNPDFNRKMAEILMLYQEVNLQNEARALPGETPPGRIGSAERKPGGEAIGNTALEHEYVNSGIMFILAALDLHTGEVIANVEERHRSQEFISLLRHIDDHYPREAVIRIVLDNHSAHISRETMAYLATRPNRFEYVHAPKNGSWLNLVETAFSKMARTFLRHIRVASEQELKDRILKGIAEWNADPVVFRWSNFDLGLK